ncbi:MAG: outer membrane beta-barrel protein [Bacteroidetes bacterium]|nr:outer membrane beta-barrel protein [Bacteroidota bacterium]
MRKILLSVGLILCFAVAFGQGAESGMFKLRSGISVPLGSYGKNGGTLDYSGFVGRGTNFGAEAVYFYGEHVGFGGLLSYSSFKLDNERFAGAYVNSNINYDTAFINVNPFRTLVGVVGFYFDLPVGDYFAFTMKMMVGSHIVQKPAGVVTVENRVSSAINFVETSTISSKFALYTGCGFRVNPYENWSITADIEYVGSKLSFEYKENANAVRNEKNIKTLVFSFGIAYFIE